jgi:branched-chain amino acid transport system substrate-binding protein
VRGRKFAVAASALALGVGLAACGSSNDNNKSSSGGGGGGGGGGTVDVYSSLPLQGASKDQTGAMVNGIRLALSEAGGKAGNYTVKYTALDDSTAQAGNWDPGQTAQNARKVAQDSKAVGYIGEFNSGASAVSIPILNQAGVPQVSPANTYVGLTTSEPGSEKGEPQKYYPTGKRTYLRIVPRDLIQAKALLTLMKQDGCTKIGVANDKDTYGAGLARTLLFASAQTGQKNQIVSNSGIDKTAPNFRSYASTLKAKGVDCFLFSGITANGAVQLMKDVHAALPSAKLYGPDGICESGFTNPSKKGAPADVTKQFQCTVATLNLASYPGGQDFLKAYKTKYGDAHPDPYAIYGFEGMKLFIDTIKKLGDKGTDKSAVLDALFATKNRSSVLGTYSFDQNGDTTLTDYGVYKVGSDGNPAFEKAIKAGSS